MRLLRSKYVRWGAVVLGCAAAVLVTRVVVREQVIGALTEPEAFDKTSYAQALSSVPMGGGPAGMSGSPPGAPGPGGMPGGGPGGPPAGGPGGGDSGGAPEVEAAPTVNADSGSGMRRFPTATPRQLIRTGHVTIEVKDAQAAVQKLQQVATTAEGFAANTSMSRSGDGGQNGSITLRVPSSAFDKTIDKVREAGKVRDWSTNTQDVTAEYVDLEARLRNARREEQEVAKLYDRSGRLEDLIKVSTRLGEVRGTIERLEGQMRVMKDQVSLCTITVMVYEPGEAPVPQTGAYSLLFHLRGAVRALTVIARGILTTLVYVTISGAVLWVPALAIVLIVRYRRRRREVLKALAEPGDEAGDDA